MAKPRTPESAPDATRRMAAGEPTDPDGTQRLQLRPDLESSAEPPKEAGGVGSQTVHLRPPQGGEPPIRLRKADAPAEAEGQTQKGNFAGPGPRVLGWKWPLAVGCLVVLLAATYLVFSRGPAAPAPSGPTSGPAEAIPPGAQVYVDQAKAGDVHAMRMLGVMYYYGLNVPQDRTRGLYWYRQAAAQGSDAAKAELSRLETPDK